MKYVIMCAGKGTRWNNYLGIPKHLIEINGETLLGRTTRLLKENGITDYVITGSDDRYRQYGKLIPQTNNDCEIDRFEEVEDNEICYLYGDVYYSEDAINKIVTTDTNEILFFGSDYEIFGIKIKDKKLFFKHKNKVKKLYLENKIDRCIGWEVYKSLNKIPLDGYAITDIYYLIEDETDDIDYPEDYENFKRRYEMIKVEVIKEFTYRNFDELEDIKRRRINTKGKLYVGDTFKCDEKTAKYLTGENDKGEVVVKIIEVIPEKKKEQTIKKSTKSKKKK